MTRTAHHTLRSRRSIAMIVLAAVCASVMPAGRAAAQPAVVPQELQGAGVTERLGEVLPLDTELVDESGRTVRLGEYFKSGRPVVLNFVYYDCPMLCTLALNGLLQVQQKLEWTAGDQFQVVSISFDPKNTPALAAEKKANYIRELGRPSAASGWAFLTGSEASTKKLADAAGFAFKWVESEKQFSHGAALIIVTPDGKISRYLGGVYYEPQTLRLALVEASDGKVGTLHDMFLMLCGRYDPNTGRYVLAAWKVMRLGGALTVGVLLSVLGTLWLRDFRRRKVTADHVQPRPA